MNKTVLVVVGIILAGISGLLILTSNNNAPQAVNPEDQEPPIAEELSITGSVDQSIAYGEDANDLNKATQNDTIKPFNQQAPQQQVQGEQTQQQGQPTYNGQPIPPLPNQVESATKVTIQTSKGNISLELYPNEAPNTVSNFVKKIKSGYYKNLSFHRVEDWVIQGGDPKGNGTGGSNNMKTELNDKPFIVGSLGVARGADINVSNDSQFFITKTEASWLNKQYTNFGIVLEGMDVVDTIAIGDKIVDITIEE